MPASDLVRTDLKNDKYHHHHHQNMAAQNKILFLDEVGDELKFVIREEDIPKTPKDCVLVKVAHAGVCHSDCHLSSKGFLPGQKYPCILGHEISGTVEAIGEDVVKGNPSFSVGDNVAVYPWFLCNKCNICVSGQPYCLEHVAPGRGIANVANHYMYGIRKNGGFQKYFMAHGPNFIVKVPDGIAMDTASLVPCSGITALNACTVMKDCVERGAKVNDSGKAKIAVIGAGGLALWAIQILKALYKGKVEVVAVDIMDEKLEDARTQGADKTHKWAAKGNPEDTVEPFLADVGGLLDGAIDFIGNENVQTRIYTLLNAGATLSFVGLGHGNVPTISLHVLIHKGLTFKGIMTGSKESCHEIFDMILSGKIKPPPITTIRLEDVADSVGQMKLNKVRGRHVVKM